MGLKKPSNTEAKTEEVQTETTVKAEVNAVEAETTPAKESNNSSMEVKGSTSMAVNSGSLEATAAEDGFEGLEVGFHSYTTIKLPSEGTFQDSEGNDYGNVLEVNLLQSKARYLYAQKGVEDGDVEYSYDKITTAKGEPLAPILEEWVADGETVEEKNYLDVMAEVLSGDLEGEIVILSIPKTGIQKFTGHYGKMKRKGLDPANDVTEVYVGKKIMTVAKPFYPWAFRIKK